MNPVSVTMTTSARRGAALRLLATGTALSLGALMMTSCGPGSQQSGQSEKGGEVTVFAASSMTQAGEKLKEAYEKEHPNTELTFNFAGSSALVQQLGQGAPADLFISADQRNMDQAQQLEAFQGTEDPEVIATNVLRLVTAAGNPAGIESIQDIGDDRIALCAPEVPCGTLAHQAIEEAGVTVEQASEEANVSAVATKVSEGVVDAGFIYSTNAKSLQAHGGDHTVIDLEGIEKNEYPMGLTAEGEKNQAARDFAAWLKGEKAQKILAEFGFGPAD